MRDWQRLSFGSFYWSVVSRWNSKFLFSKAVSFRCLLLHKNAGDTERKYHLRHYKTVICPNETDNSGHCVKNGAHCPFSHTKSDVRQPIYGREEVKVSYLFTPHIVSIVLCTFVLG